LIISHHGEYEYGSPRRPKTLEALLFSHIDDLDAKMNGVSRFMSQQEWEDLDWTGHHGVFGRPFYRNHYISDPESVPGLDEEEAEGKEQEDHNLPLFNSRH